MKNGIINGLYLLILLVAILHSVYLNWVEILVYYEYKNVTLLDFICAFSLLAVSTFFARTYPLQSYDYYLLLLFPLLYVGLYYLLYWSQWII